MAECAMGVTRACGLVGLSRSLFRYESRRADAVELTGRIAAIATQKRRYGYRRIHRIHVLLRREGWQVNHKRI
jgi:putative transposase